MISINFLQSVLADSGGCWDQTRLAKIAGTSAPDVILGKNHDLIRSDVHQQWAKWFVESFVDPRSYNAVEYDYLKVFKDVWEAVNIHLSHIPHTQKRSAASLIAKSVREFADAINIVRKRESIGYRNKRLLLDLSGSPPRCWHCGYIFSQEAIEMYLGNSKNEIRMPHLFDVLRPRGIISTDLKIEIDHLVPFSNGGNDDDNLILSCGWCNRHKSNHVSIYDVSGVPISCAANEIGISSVPRPFWVLRVLSIRSSCEFHNGCDKSSKNEQLMIAPVCSKGALNPTNLMVTCLEHDPLKERRFQPRNVIDSIWGYDRANPIASNTL